MIEEKEVLEHIGAAIDELDMEQLACLHNQLSSEPVISWAAIKPNEGWHLVPKEGAH